MNKLNTHRTLRNYRRLKLVAMRKIAKNSVNFFKDDVFEAQGFIDNSVKRWVPSKKSRGKTLIKTGRGRNSIRESSVTEKKIRIRANAPYINFHQTGTRTLAKRKFMGKSNRLDAQNK